MRKLTHFCCFFSASEPEDLVTYLENRGHNVTRLSQNVTLGIVDMLLWTEAGLRAVDDQRDSALTASLVF